MSQENGPVALAHVVSALVIGNHDALGELMDRFGEALMRYILAIVGKREQAEDIFQETWLKVMEGIAGFDVSRPFAPWLFRIARNRAYDDLRRHIRWRFLRIDAPSDEGEERVFDLPTKDNEITSVLDRELVSKLLLRLGPAARELIWLRFYGDFSYEELASILRIPIGTVKSRLSRVLTHLAEIHRELAGGNNAKVA